MTPEESRRSIVRAIRDAASEDDALAVLDEYHDSVREQALADAQYDQPYSY